MPFTANMPKLSPTMEEGTIAKWHCKEGDKVESGSVLIEVTTDKATVEHAALDEGYLRKILVQEGETAKVNQPIAIFTETADESIEDFKTEEAKEEKPAEEKPTDEKKEKTVEKTEEQKPKAAQAEFKQPAFVPYPPLEEYEFKFPSGDVTERVSASPLARKIAREKGLDLTSVKGSGPNNRIMSRDLDLAQPKAAVSFGRKEVPTTRPGEYEEVPLTPMRKAIGVRLQQSKTFIPHFYISQEVQVDTLVDTREKLKDLGMKVTFNDFVIRACALALKDHPNVNAGFNSQNQSIVYYKTIDISMAVTVEGGLITPILRHADYKNLGEISAESKELAKKARDGKLKPEEYQGGSFTVSNLGMFGISEFVAVINPPQSSILAIGGIAEKPVAKRNQIVIGKTMMLTLSADHRVVDGSDGAKFIKDVQKYLENPISLLL